MSKGSNASTMIGNLDRMNNYIHITHFFSLCNNIAYSLHVQTPKYQNPCAKVKSSKCVNCMVVTQLGLQTRFINSNDKILKLVWESFA